MYTCSTGSSVHVRLHKPRAWRKDQQRYEYNLTTLRVHRSDNAAAPRPAITGTANASRVCVWFICTLTPDAVPVFVSCRLDATQSPVEAYVRQAPWSTVDSTTVGNNIQVLFTIRSNVVYNGYVARVLVYMLPPILQCVQRVLLFWYTQQSRPPDAISAVRCACSARGLDAV